ncbi:MAG: VOC family protein [Nitrospirae bacterium]|nr:VOC family protein [Nitrospirota bacterium]MBI3594276.1 VOC family protein [Nitrospirota bacterium]
MKAHHLGHVVFYVRNLKRSLAFYQDLLGFKRIENGQLDFPAAALTSGRNHHEILLIEVGEDARGPSPGKRTGLYHIGIKIGDDLDALRAAKNELEAAKVSIKGMSDHTVSQSIYILDPDGNEVEVYVDANPSIWQNRPEAVLSPTKPLNL